MLGADDNGRTIVLRPGHIHERYLAAVP